MRRRTSTLHIVLAAGLAVAPSEAQTSAPGLALPRDAARRELSRPLPLAVDRARIAQLDTVLPILDDMGEVITEDQIRTALRTGHAREFLYGGLGFVLGSGLAALLVPTPANGADCSIHEPCTDREKFYETGGFIAGGIVGALLGGLMPEHRRDRYAAVEYIRALRRAPGVPR